MHWVIALSRLQLTQLVTDDALCAICIKLHYRAADRKIAGVTDHMTWSVLICNRQDPRLHQAPLDTFIVTLALSVP